MATAIAPNLDAADAYPEFHIDPHGVQGLLQPKPQKPHYYAQAGAAAVYALLLGAVVTLTFKAAEQPVEEQQVIELAPIPAEELPPEDTLPPPEELALPDPPPPPLIDPVAPVEEVKPAPKPIEKPKIERKSRSRRSRNPEPTPGRRRRRRARRPRRENRCENRRACGARACRAARSHAVGDCEPVPRLPAARCRQL